MEGEFKNGELWNGKKRDYFNRVIEIRNGKNSGKIFEYDSDGNIKLEGQYINGEVNGKGKEYDKGKLIFDGEYLNEKRWKGIKKEYDYDGNKIFEGEYLKGKRNGNGKEYDSYGKLKFEGEYLNGKRNETEKNMIVIVN